MTAPDICDRTFEFARRVIHVCKTLEEQGGIARTLGRQLLRAGTSVGANVQEGQAGQSRADFVSKYSIARKELRETLYWLRLLAAEDLVPANRLEPLMAESDELLRILTTIILRSRGPRPQPEALP